MSKKYPTFAIFRNVCVLIVQLSRILIEFTKRIMINQIYIYNNPLFFRHVNAIILTSIKNSIDYI